MSGYCMRQMHLSALSLTLSNGATGGIFGRRGSGSVPQGKQNKDRQQQGSANGSCTEVAKDTRTSMLFKASSHL